MKPNVKIFLVVIFLVASSLVLADGIPVVLKPHPGFPTPGDVIPFDTFYASKPTILSDVQNEGNSIECYLNPTSVKLISHIDLLHTTVMIYGFPSGVRYNSVIDLITGEPYSIDIDYPAGIYTIRLTLSDGTVLEGNFVINRE